MFLESFNLIKNSKKVTEIFFLLLKEIPEWDPFPPTHTQRNTFKNFMLHPEWFFSPPSILSVLWKKSQIA